MGQAESHQLNQQSSEDGALVGCAQFLDFAQGCSPGTCVQTWTPIILPGHTVVLPYALYVCIHACARCNKAHVAGGDSLQWVCR